ncbi:response regulator, partial [Spirosoma jeollabukense]
MTILAADDHPLIRMSFEWSIPDLIPQARLIQCASFEEVLTTLEQQPIDLIILDIDMPDTQNSQMMTLIRAKQPQVLILIYSGLDELVFALPYIKAGADGYLAKSAPQADLKTAITALLNKGKYVSPSVQQLVLNNLGKKDQSWGENPLQSLSPNEQKVLNLMAEGKWTKDIADILKLKATTVSTY